MIEINTEPFNFNLVRYPLARDALALKMSEHIYRKFPDRAAVIQALMNKDAIFRETCDDYEEMCTWLAAQSSSIDPHSAEYVDTYEIIRELEEEIEKMLKDSGLQM